MDGVLDLSGEAPKKPPELWFKSQQRTNSSHGKGLWISSVWSLSDAHFRGSLSLQRLVS